jgi:ABC-2 type transport system ATP-binding protein
LRRPAAFCLFGEVRRGRGALVAVIEIEGLRKVYRGRPGVRRAALDGFDMLVQAGEVHGFLGPNGSGKTTTLRTLVGLVRADAGTLRVLGRPVPAGLPQISGRIGAMVEGPQSFPNFTARRTLQLLATIGRVASGRVNEVLDVVGLAERADERVRTFSLGMKQRLAVGAALLKSPELLILDEPANGLDPAGIREMRDLVRAVVAGGSTVVLSSHILGEVQQICDRVTIVARGRRVASGPVAEVLASQDKGEFKVGVRDRDRAAAVLTAAGATVRPAATYLIVSGVPDPEWISSTLGRHDLWTTEIAAVTPDLESVFLHITGESQEAS